MSAAALVLLLVVAVAGCDHRATPAPSGGSQATMTQPSSTPMPPDLAALERALADDTARDVPPFGADSVR
ncbi:MAG TPA: hypothetical protein VF516_03985, partial [Kofleriaceae bacterium]